jgi:light-regulated signal transduction histidine kinase (bacteriophytochrome)
VALAREVAERRRAEGEIRRHAAELARSNAELEQFAYVASHDLQEPLRMVTSYVQLLERRYRSRLDPDADEFIGYAVEGATRMKALINDLLAYSRVGTRGRDPVPVPLDAALDDAPLNLSVALREAGGEVTGDPLPVVRGDPGQLTQLLQNLVGNALKFRGEAPARVHLTAHRDGALWEVAVADHGIGIDPAHAERIFGVFQRLHPRARHPGNGIGLAVCKKIVERHGGRVWVESASGAGATFRFTLPAAEEEPRADP